MTSTAARTETNAEVVGEQAGAIERDPVDGHRRSRLRRRIMRRFSLAAACRPAPVDRSCAEVHVGDDAFRDVSPLATPVVTPV
jgi:hypothetical protein